MNQKIAIHKYNDVFTNKWINYLTNLDIQYTIVDCYENDIINVMRDYDILLWSWNLSEFESLQFASELTFSLEKMGKIVFPNFNSSFLYDNKVGQKYLLEAINAPVINSHVFYQKTSALKWINKTTYPTVFKLSGGAGSQNVKLVNNSIEAIKLTNTAFGKGFPVVDRKEWFKDKYNKFIHTKSRETFILFIKSFFRLFIKTKKERLIVNEKGYIYFQEFIPNNSFDLRVVVIGGKAIAFKRLCRKGDFRASGSGNSIFNKDEISVDAIRIAFEVSNNLNTQCMAYDFIFDINENPLIVEISYHFASKATDNCEGYWDSNLNWHDIKVNPQNEIIDNIIGNYE